MDLYRNHWLLVTQNLGDSFSPFIPESASLLSIVEAMLKRDIYLRLKDREKFDHVGMGPFPKLAEDTLRSQSSLPFQQYNQSNLTGNNNGLKTLGQIGNREVSYAR